MRKMGPLIAWWCTCPMCSFVISCYALLASIHNARCAFNYLPLAAIGFMVHYAAPYKAGAYLKSRTRACWRECRQMANDVFFFLLLLLLVVVGFFVRFFYFFIFFNSLTHQNAVIKKPARATSPLLLLLRRSHQMIMMMVLARGSVVSESIYRQTLG